MLSLNDDLKPFVSHFALMECDLHHTNLNQVITPELSYFINKYSTLSNSY